MIRLGAIFVAVCAVVIAASLGAVAYLYVGLSGATASVLALAVLTALMLYNSVATRLRDRADIGTRIADLSRGSVDLAKRVAELGRRVAAIEGKVDASSSKAGTIADPVATELEELGSLVQQLAETVASHDAAINAGGEVAPPPVQPMAADSGSAAEPSETPVRLRVVDSAMSDDGDVRDNQAMVETVRNAVEAGRIDLYLQPIVTLPQRKVRYYEALSRMRAENGDVVTAADFLDAAEAAGVMAQIDDLALFRSVQVARRLMMKNRDIGMFCNMAASTLADAGFFPRVAEFIDANRALTSALVFEFSQRAVRALGPMEQESLSALADSGFRYSMDQVSDLRFEPRALSERGFRFVKVPASRLLSPNLAAGSDIHPADLADLLNRHGIDLIASHVESEGSVVDLLDFDVRYGQGLLFSPPRPVRQEALRGALDRSEGVASEQAVGDDRAGRAVGGSLGGLGAFARTAFDPA